MILNEKIQLSRYRLFGTFSTVSVRGQKAINSDEMGHIIFLKLPQDTELKKLPAAPTPDIKWPHNHPPTHR